MYTPGKVSSRHSKMLQLLLNNFLRWLVTVLLIVTAACSFVLLLGLLLWILYACLYGARQENLAETAVQKPLLQVLEPPRTSSVPVVSPPPPVRPVDTGVGAIPLMAARTNPPAPVEVELPPLPRNTSQTEAAFTSGNQAKEAAKHFEIISRSSGTDEDV